MTLDGWPAGVSHDPWFYAVAIPAAALIGLSKSGFGSGFGSLATPLLALVMPVPVAAAVLLPLLCISDFTGFAVLARSADWGLLRRMLPAGLAGIALGWLTFGQLPERAVAGLLGGVTLFFLAQRLLFPPKADAPVPGHGVRGLLSTLSGYTSFVAHAGGPPIAMALLPLKLAPMVYSGTQAIFFTTINLSKWVPYALLGTLDLQRVTEAVVLMPVSMLAVAWGARLARVISPKTFFHLIHAGMAVTGVKLLWDALH